MPAGKPEIPDVRSSPADAGGPQVFRSPAAVVIWWVWVLFAVGNLIDLAVQGRDHIALVAAFILLLVTGIVYVSALRPKLIADASGLTVVNPVSSHRVGWAALAGADPTDLLRVRCAWPEGDGTRQRAIYAWAVHSSRRRQVAAELKAQRQSRRGAGGLGGFGGAGGFGWSRGLGSAADPATPEADPLRVDAGHVITALTERAAQARIDAPDAVATAPVSAWDWPAVAAVLLPGLALLVAALV
ncbi:MAG TPA: PH domain-containing protein [Trebonia sp.]